MHVELIYSAPHVAASCRKRQLLLELLIPRCCGRVLTQKLGTCVAPDPHPLRKVGLLLVDLAQRFLGLLQLLGRGGGHGDLQQ